MLVKDWMSKNVISIDENDTILDVMKTLCQHKFHMLPVQNKDMLAGVITRGDIISAILSEGDIHKDSESHFALSGMQVKDMMTKDIVTVPVGSTIEQAAGAFIKHQVHSAPVVNDFGRMKGIVTQTDLSKALVCLSGGDRGGILFAFMLEDRSGSIKELTDIIRQHGGRLYSILTSYEGVKNGFRKLYIRAYGFDNFRLHRLTEILGKRADLIYRLDRLEIVRESNVNELPPNS
jgi:acetoin utilization protein AcuB